MNFITAQEKIAKPEGNTNVNDNNNYLRKISNYNLRDLLIKCYQCARCSSICQYSKVQKYPPSRIIQLILEGFESKVLASGILWDCISCNSCHQDCPEHIDFADIVRIAKYKMRTQYNQNRDDSIAHKGIYTIISEIMSQPHIHPERSLDWIPNGCKISDKGHVLYYVGCLPYFKFEFQNLDSIAPSTLKMISQIEKEPIVVLKEETCCGHDLYWGQGKFEAYIELAKKNVKSFENAGVSTIITACAECYKTLKFDYPKLFEDFNNKFEIKHIIEYIYEKWKQNKIAFRSLKENNEKVQFTFHDPCRLSRFLPKDNHFMENAREIFEHLKNFGYEFKEMTHNKENSLCCGINAWMNCNERSKALRYKRMLEAKSAGTIMITACPKCRIHFSCLQNDIEDIASIKIIDFAEFLFDFVVIVDSNNSVKV